MEEIKNLVNEFKENKTKLESLNKSYEDIKQLGEDTGIAQVLRTNIEKAQKEYDKVKTKMDNKFEELTTKKENLTLEISELEEKKEKVQKEIDFFDNLIKRDKENNVKNSDKIQQARIEKAGNLKDEILDIEDVIYTKNNTK